MRKCLVKTILLMGMLMGAVVLYAGCAGKAPTDTRKMAKSEAPGEILEDTERNYEKVQQRTEASNEPQEPTVTASAVKGTSSAPGRTSRVSATGQYEPPATRYKKRYPPRRSIRRTSSLANDGPEAEGEIIFNFDDADLYEVIKTMAELLEINYIVDPGIQGKVTIHTARKLKKTDLFPVFSQVLAINGLTTTKEGGLYRIVPMKDAPRMPMETVYTLGQKDVPPMNRVIIQIIPLKYISTQEMTKLLTPFLSSGGTIVASVPTNTLVVVDKGANILKMLQLMGTFDVNLLDRVYYRFFPLEYLGAEEVAGIVKEFTASYAGSSGEMVKFIALERLNTLLAVSTTPEVFDKIEELVHQLDIVDETVAARIFIYFVKNGGANELATLLNDVLTGKETKKQEKKKAGGASEVPGNPFSKAKMAEKKAEKKAEKAGQPTQKSVVGKTTSGKPGEGSSTLMGEVTITPDEIRNALIIESIPADYKIIQGILKKLDIMPRQVLIQATIAEITLDSSTKFGVEYALGQGAGALGAGFMATVGSGGLKYSIGVTNKWYAELNALATKGRLNVISSPHVLASDNQEAKIDVSREIPLASGQTNVSAGSTISETTIEYRDTGVILSVTPHINERGLVTMDISEEVSNYEGNLAVGRQVGDAKSEYPVFSKRVVKTTLTVGHGQTIAIGGLIRDREKKETRGLPCLIDVPVIKYLTGSWEKQTEKIELIVLITPRVVDDMDDVEAMTNEFKQKVQSVMKQFYPQQ